MFIKNINNKTTFINKVKNVKAYIVIIEYCKPEVLLRIFYL